MAVLGCDWCFRVIYIRFQHLRVFLAWPSKSRWETSAKSTQRNNHNNLQVTTTKQQLQTSQTETANARHNFDIYAWVAHLKYVYVGDALCTYIRRGGSESLYRTHICNDWHILLALSLLLNYNAINYYVTYENSQRDDWYGILVF